MTDKITEAAKAAGGTTYVNRHYPGETACAFGPEALERFYAIAFAAGRNRTHDPLVRSSAVALKWLILLVLMPSVPNDSALY